ncbi:intraflagellar transport protein 52 [Marchantia polymorpha subsp. ruderalis]|uniref:Intraflagellar transport protein 52 homolog n=2 Tax=Marchantia polymorpha TaxID=3197 RepID=A0AAF6BRK7_MARPO|nr:hypothetical protein MARPO_0059s0029 [Marchantia polymorpha]BBN14641.1 hypothetical protein Mp_6g13200 [Marchantia polymorpha subsp. ruderalis]|eukprot:PTQ37077.1 hypothetical protein MARPO_0059s0029 [Marchantia polymorpha]
MESGVGNCSGKGGASGPALPLIIFNCCKRESHTPNQGFKHMVRRFRGSYRTLSNKEEISLQVFNDGVLIIFGCPKEKFTPDEVEAIWGYVRGGGCLLFLSSSGGDGHQKTNVNDIIQEYGITINSDCLIRTAQEKYLHPKEVYLTDSCLCKELNNFGKSGVKRVEETPHSSPDSNRMNLQDFDNRGGDKDFHLVYPHGPTLTVQAPAAAILSSGMIAYPVNRPIGAIWEGPKGQGRIAVLGSVTAFEDIWLEKEDNSKLLDFLLLWLTRQTSIEVEKLSSEELETGDVEHVPSIGALASSLRCCLQEAEELPKDFTRLVDDKLFEYHTNLTPEVVKLYKKLGVKHTPLTLIAPQFEMPTPPLQPAVFAPALRELPPPALDLFDLDECLASPASHLAQLTNKCKGADKEDLNYYITKGASYVGLTPEIVGVAAESGSREAGMAYLSFLFKEIVSMKRRRTGSDPCHSENIEE